MEVIQTTDLCKFYGDGNTRVEALKDVSLSINQGEFVAVVGASGSGKSTLLHLLGALDKPTSGKVIVDGQNVYSLKEEDKAIFRRRKVGFVFQSYNLIPVLTVEENMVMPVLLDHRKPDMKYIDEIIGILGLGDRRNHLPSELSGGQQQRVSIGRALAYKPAIILADEPTGNLDSQNGKEVIELLHFSVKRYHQTVVVITHDMGIASEADRVIRLKDGSIIEDRVVRA